MNGFVLVVCVLHFKRIEKILNFVTVKVSLIYM